MVYGASEYSKCIAIDGATGETLWEASDYLPECSSLCATKSLVFCATSYGMVCAYDAKTAEYRFCRILGVTPTYIMPDGIEYADGRNLQSKKMQQFRNEMRSGSLAQWMSVFFHEDPNVDFSQEYSYEHAVEDWLMAMGKIDPSQRYYKRFIDARDETQKRVKHVKDSWQRAKTKEKIWRMAFFGLSGIWIAFVLLFGVTNHDYILTHTFIAIGV